MTRIGAYTPETAALVLEVVNRLVSAGYVTRKGTTREPRNDYQQGGMYLTPAGGIPAAAGDTPGEAECTPLRFDENNKIVELTDANGDSITHTVYNIFENGNVAGDRRIQTHLIYGRRTAHAEDCNA